MPATVPKPLVLPDAAARVAELVAEEFAGHQACVERRFARQAARALLDMCPRGEGPEEAAGRRWLEAAARVVLAQAGIPAAETPDCLETP